MFLVTDSVSSKTTKVRQPVYLKRVEKLQALCIAMPGLVALLSSPQPVFKASKEKLEALSKTEGKGKKPTQDEAHKLLTDNYCNNETREKFSVNFVGVPNQYLPQPAKKEKAAKKDEKAKASKPAKKSTKKAAKKDKKVAALPESTEEAPSTSSTEEVAA